MSLDLDLEAAEKLLAGAESWGVIERKEFDDLSLDLTRAFVTEVRKLRADCASLSAEFGLPPTMRPAEGEIRRMMALAKESGRLRRHLGRIAEAKDLSTAHAVAKLALDGLE